MVRTKHALCFTFGDRARDPGLPSSRTLYPGWVDLATLRSWCRQADAINGRRRKPRTYLGPILARRGRS